MDARSTTFEPGVIEHHKLSPLLRILVRVLGEGHAFRLVERCSGVPLWLPKQAAPDHWLWDFLGEEAFRALLAAFADGPAQLEMPKYDGVLRQLRHQRVRELLMQPGLTVSEVARRTDYSKRQVLKIKKRIPRPVLPMPTAAQGRLFDDAPPADRKVPLPLPAAHNPFPSPAKTPAESV